MCSRPERDENGERQGQDSAQSSKTAATSVGRFFCFLEVQSPGIGIFVQIMYFGRLITGGKKVKVPWFIKTEDTFTDDKTLPTAILGKKFAEETFGKDNVHVLDREICDGVTWVYGKTENRSKHSDELDRFFNSCFIEKTSPIGYHFINIFTERYSYFKKLIKYIDSPKKKSVYVTDRHVYIYGGKDVAGISLHDCRYAGISPKRIVSRIRDNESNVVFGDDYFLSRDDRKYIGDRKMLIPVLHFNYYSAFSHR